MSKSLSPYRHIYGWLANGEQVQVSECNTADGYRDASEEKVLRMIQNNLAPTFFRVAPNVATFTITCAHDKVGQFKAAMEKLGATLTTPAP